MVRRVPRVEKAIFAFYARQGKDPVRDALHGDADWIFPYFVLHELPHGLPGLLVAAVLGSTMSVFSGGLNAASTSIYVDIIDHALGRGVEPARVVAVTRVLMVALAATSIGLAFAAAHIASLVKQSVTLMGLALGPLLGVNLLGMLTVSANWQGGMAGLCFGIAASLWLGVAGIMCTTADANAGSCAAPWQVARVSFLWYGFMLAVATFVVGYAVSLCFPAPHRRQLAGLTVWSTAPRGPPARRSEDEGEDWLEKPLLALPDSAVSTPGTGACKAALGIQ